MDIRHEVLSIVDETLCLKGNGLRFSEETLLLGAIPELDSMAVVGLISSLEARFGFVVDDDEIDGSVFESVGSLVGFVRKKMAT